MEKSSPVMRASFAFPAFIILVFLLACILQISVGALPIVTPNTNGGAFTVHLRVDAAQPVGKLRSFWRFFGADEPNYATMKNGGKLVGELGELAKGNVYFRAHNLLTSGDGTPALKWGSTGAYKENADGQP